MIVFEIILFILSIIILFFSFIFCRRRIVINRDIMRENEELEKNNIWLKKEQLRLCDEKIKIIEDTKVQTEILHSLNEEQEKIKQNANDEFENYKNLLQKKYEEEKKDWEYSTSLLEESYSNLQEDILSKLNVEYKELDKVRAKRASAQQALIREKEIKENKDFYCLQIKNTEKNDIQILEKIKKELNQPRILSMLIWSTFFQKQMTTLCNNVLGTRTVCGIYKITNQITNECYIGQSVDVSKRWKDHVKCGLGIDTPAGNKLYSSMQEYGVWNFSFELLEECSRENLNEEEKYYIELYMSNDYGFNSTKGNK